MIRPVRPRSSRVLPALSAALLSLAGCSSPSVEAPPTPTAVNAAPKPPAKAGQPGATDYSGKGISTGAAEGR